MVCRLPKNIIHQVANHILLTSEDKSVTWFSQIKSLCYQYNLPHPLLLLQNPQPKEAFKKLVKSNVLDYWQSWLRTRCSELRSLQYFHPQFMSLQQPHPIFATTSTPYDVNKAVVQARMLSARYRCGSLVR